MLKNSFAMCKRNWKSGSRNEPQNFTGQTRVSVISSGRLMQLRDEERRRRARDLHDSVGQLLAAISLNIAGVQSQSHKLDSAVAENAALVKQITDEILTLSYLLHPPLLDEAGLATALQCYVDGFSQPRKIKIALEISAGFGRLSSEMEIAIFRTVQECLTNIHRHSGSSSAAIRIRLEDGRVLVTIRDRDTGKGIPPGTSASHQLGWGRRGLPRYARAVAHPGRVSLKIDSTGSGTLVTMTLPLQGAGAVEDGAEVAKPGRDLFFLVA
jgi:signal transduction histidine kinase